jgi:hypothetical protein
MTTEIFIRLGQKMTGPAAIVDLARQRRGHSGRECTVQGSNLRPSD